ncbi:hypothetical protein PRUPE_3G289300 [Prunus persica]|uniref:Uncharacterized protein n=1 Tax=Prunus persica TaxID=3760 RepID=A0A251Q739_PRUPE|nr:uncharacterized protein LOC18782032 isoform X2 [Prunus persica]ONI19646.1 hypothetical protein PRUPE_3G289300 [Prunus persica]
MANARKFLCSFRQSLDLLISSRSSISHSRQFSYAEFEPLKALLKGVQPVLRNRASAYYCSLNMQRNSLQKFWFSGGSILRFGSILGVSVFLGSISFLPNAAYAMDDVEEDQHAVWMFVRKIWLPFFFFVTMLAYWDDSVTLAPFALKLILFLLSTKPSPFSVYGFVDELCHRLKRGEPHLYNKSLYASKVEVEDFQLLCLARVEVRDQKYTLVGILGGWWPLPTLDAIKHRLLHSHKEL